MKHLFIFTLTIFALQSAQALDSLRNAQIYEKSRLEKGIVEYVGIKTKISSSPFSISLKDNSIELFKADDSCGTQGCQYFIVQKIATKVENKPKYKLLGDFFGRYKVLESSKNGYRDIEIYNDVGGEKSTYILKFTGESFAR